MHIDLNQTQLTIRGVAGGRKTQMAIDIAKDYPNKKFLYLSYGRANANNVRTRFPENVDIHTYHSYAFYHFKTKLGYAPNVVDAIRHEHLFENTIPFEHHHAQLIVDGLNYYSTNPGNMNGYSKKLRSQYPDLDPDIHELVLKAANVYIKHAMSNGAPVTHEMYLKLATKEPLHINHYDVLISDEHQDTSRSMQGMLAQLDLDRRRCTIKLGDPCQQIFQHLGAHLDTSLITPDMQWVKSYRCNEEVVAIANKITKPHFFHWGVDPMVASHNNGGVHYYGKETTLPDRAAILSYHNASVISQAITLNKKGESVSIHSPSLIKGIRVYADIIKKINSGRAAKHILLDAELRRAIANSNREKVIAARVIAKHLNDLNELTTHIDKLRKPQDDAKYLLATIHYTKGMTFNNVVIGEDCCHLDKETTYNANVLYTGITRAARDLYLPEGF